MTQPPLERRRRRDREKYLILRFYARVLSLLAYAGVVVGLVFAVLVIFFAELPLALRLSNALVSVGAGAVYFVILRATAEAIYLLFDVARHSRASRELLERAGATAAAPPPRTGPGD